MWTINAIAVLDGNKSILSLRDVRPFFSDKYDITQHPNYKYLADSDKKNALNVERFLSTQLKIKTKEVFDVYSVDMTEITQTTKT